MLGDHSFVGKLQPSKKGFSLAEVLLAIGLAAVVLLALVGQNTMLLASNQKLDDTTVATDVAYSIIEQLSSEIQTDPVKRNDAFLQNNPTAVFDSGAVTVGNTDYLYEVYLSDVTDTASGAAVGSGPAGSHTTKLKKMDILVNWWADQQRQNMGNLSLRVSRLMKVSNV